MHNRVKDTLTEIRSQLEREKLHRVDHTQMHPLPKNESSAILHSQLRLPFQVSEEPPSQMLPDLFTSSNTVPPGADTDILKGGS